MGDLATEIVERLRGAWRPAADPDHAVGAAAYMRDQFPYLGVRTPVRRKLQRAALRDLPAPSESELAEVALALWGEPEREFQHAGCDYLRTHVGVAPAGFVDVLHELVTTKAWWDTVDVLAAHTAGPLVRAHPELVAVMDEWVRADELWVARTALLHQLAAKDETDAERLFRHCRLRAGDREFFIRKAIGWALRNHAARAPDDVAAFVAATPELSALSVREAMRGVDRARSPRPGSADRRRRPPAGR